MNVLIIGAGGVGSLLAKKLSEAGHSVTVVDKDDDKISRISAEADVEAIVNDATEPTLYDEIQMDSFDVVVAATDRDEVNLFVATLARMYGVERVFVRVKNPHTARLLRMLGITGVVPEPQLVANVLYSFIHGYYGVVELIPALTGEYSVVALLVKPTSPARGKRTEEVAREIEQAGGRLLLVFYDTRFMEPEEVPVIEEGALLVILASRDALRRITQLV